MEEMTTHKKEMNLSLTCQVKRTPSEVVLEFLRPCTRRRPRAHYDFLLTFIKNGFFMPPWYMASSCLKNPMEIGSGVWNSIGFLSSLRILKQLQTVLEMKIKQELVIRARGRPLIIWVGVVKIAKKRGTELEQEVAQAKNETGGSPRKKVESVALWWKKSFKKNETGGSQRKK